MPTFVQPLPWSYEDFPDSTLEASGMETVAADLTRRYGTVRLAVPYAEKSGRVLHLQVILPPGFRPEEDRGARHPTILYVQGSAFHEQNLGQELPALADFARRGYVVAIVEYRPSELAPFPAQAKDAASAVRWLRRHAGEFGVDAARMALWGNSSGGHTALMLYAAGSDPAFSDEPVEEGDEDDDDGGLGLRCFVDYYGPTDISRMNEEPSIMDHLGADSPEGYLIGRRPVNDNPDLVAPTVIANHVPDAGLRRLKPLLIVHGSKDRLVPFGQSVALYSTLVGRGQPARLVRLQGSDHGGPAFWQPEVLDLVDAFLREHLT